jgi:hypothetical protein
MSRTARRPALKNPVTETGENQEGRRLARGCLHDSPPHSCAGLRAGEFHPECRTSGFGVRTQRYGAKCARERRQSSSFALYVSRSIPVSRASAHSLRTVCTTHPSGATFSHPLQRVRRSGLCPVQLKVWSKAGQVAVRRHPGIGALEMHARAH